MLGSRKYDVLTTLRSTVIHVLTYKRKQCQSSWYSQKLWNASMLTSNFYNFVYLIHRAASVFAVPVLSIFNFFWPDTKDDLRQCAQAGDKEHSVDKLALDHGVVLSTHTLREKERDGDDPTARCQVVLHTQKQMNVWVHWHQSISQHYSHNCGPHGVQVYRLLCLGL